MGPHHMSAQEESAALLKELYAQQLANSQVGDGAAHVLHVDIIDMQTSQTGRHHRHVLHVDIIDM